MKKYILGVLGLVLMALMLWLLFRETDWQEVGNALRGAGGPLTTIRNK